MKQKIFRYLLFLFSFSYVLVYAISHFSTVLRRFFQQIHYGRQLSTISIDINLRRGTLIISTTQTPLAKLLCMRNSQREIPISDISFISLNHLEWRPRNIYDVSGFFPTNQTLRLIIHISTGPTYVSSHEVSIPHIIPILRLINIYFVEPEPELPPPRRHLPPTPPSTLIAFQPLPELSSTAQLEVTPKNELDRAATSDNIHCIPPSSLPAQTSLVEISHRLPEDYIERSSSPISPKLL